MKHPMRLMTGMTFIFAATLLPGAFGLNLAWDGPARPLVGDAAGFYNYAPSSVLLDGLEYHLYCTNKAAYSIRDHIGLAITRPADQSVVAGKKIVLAPGPAQWEAQYDCDPSVVKGRFTFQGVTYAWAMVYLGEDFEPKSCMRNQIGVALATDLAGPWVKVPGNPLVTFESGDYWGVGQPSVLSLDQGGRVLLLYTRGDAAGTRVLRRELDLSDLDHPVVGSPEAVSTAGLIGSDGKPDALLNNADFAYDRAHDRYFVLRPRHPSPAQQLGDVVEAELDVAWMDGPSFRADSQGRWRELGVINQGLSGRARNHNGGFLRDPYGDLPDPTRLTVLFCASNVADLWSYRLYRVSATLSEAGQVNVSNIRQPYAPDGDTVFLFHLDGDGGTTNSVPNAVPGGWNAWANSVLADPASRRFDPAVPTPGFGSSVYFSGSDRWPRIDTLVTDQGVLDTAEPYTNQLTLEAWICPAALGGVRRVISRAQSHFLYFADDEVEFWVDFAAQPDMSDAITLRTTGARLKTGQWRHIAGMWDGSQISIWLDGVMAASQVVPGKGPMRRPTTADWLVIGAAPWPGENFCGNMDEVRTSRTARLNLTSRVAWDWANLE